MIRRILVTLLLLGAPMSAHATEKPPVAVAPPDPARVAEIAALLGDGPVLPPYADEAFWAEAAKIPHLQEVVKRAEESRDTPAVDMAEFDRTYRRFLTDGNRTEFSALIAPATRCIPRFALAECVERKGRFVDLLEARISELCDWPTWMWNAHDWDGYRNLEEKIVQIDLGVAQRAADIAAAVMVIGDRMDPKAVVRFKGELRRRVLVPYRLELEGKQAPNFWLQKTHNWSAVCHTGVVLAALAAGESREEIAWYLAAVERMNGNFLAGFTRDGYCSEGIGYWGYGYGHFILFAEYIRRATGGGVDLFDQEASLRAACFPLGMGLVDGWFPAFADCVVTARPTQPSTWYVARRLGTADPGEGTSDHPCAGAMGLYGTLLFIDPESVPAAEGKEAIGKRPVVDPLRSSFRDGGVWLMRAPGEKPFAAAIKAGHNDEHHNHNDVGSFTLVAGGFPLLCDPGKEVYTQDTFHPDRRYQSPVHNSYGHPVPVVAGKLQETGGTFAGKLLEHETGDGVETVILDLAGAYEVPDLESLTRTLVFDRTKRTVTVTDAVRFTGPQTFATALLTYATVERDDDLLTVSHGDAACTVRVAVEGAVPVFSTEVLEADWQVKSKGWDAAGKPTRIGIACDAPVTAATITMTVSLP